MFARLGAGGATLGRGCGGRGTILPCLGLGALIPYGAPWVWLAVAGMSQVGTK